MWQKKKVGVESIKVLDSSPEEVGCFKVPLIEKIMLSPGPLKISKPKNCAYEEPIARNPEASLYCGDVVVSYFLTDNNIHVKKYSR